MDARDASDALYAMRGFKLDGRELAIVFAKDRRKTPDEMKTLVRSRDNSRERGGGGDRSRSRSPPADRHNDSKDADEDDRGGDRSRRGDIDGDLAEGDGDKRAARSYDDDA